MNTLLPQIQAAHNSPTRLSRLSGGGLAYAVSRSAEEYWRTLGPAPLLCVLPSPRDAEVFLSDLRFFVSEESDARVHFLPAWEILPFDLLSPALGVSAERISALWSLRVGGKSILVLAAETLLQKVITPASLEQWVMDLATGQEFDRERFVRLLERRGYAASTLAEEVGQYAMRGGVLDIFSPGEENPFRVEFWGSTIESIRTFDPASQRSLSVIERARILPTRELLYGNPQDEQLSPKDMERISGALRERVSELSLPQSVLRPIEDSLAQGVFWPGLEHLQPLLQVPLDSLFAYLANERSRANLILIDELGVLHGFEHFARSVTERAEIAEREGRLFPDPNLLFLSPDDCEAEVRGRARLFVDKLDFLSDAALSQGAGSVHSEGPIYAPLARLRGLVRGAVESEAPLKPLVEEMRRYQSRGFTVGIVARSERRAERLQEILHGYEVNLNSFASPFQVFLELQRDGRFLRAPVIIEGSLSSGFESKIDSFVLISESDVFPDLQARGGRAQKGKQKGAVSLRKLLGQISQLAENDFVVHSEYGIGIYRGLRSFSIDGALSDFLEVEYAEEAKLFVPVEHIGKVQKFAGAGGKSPALTRLGGKHWEQTKKKVRENVAELAGQLLRLMAERELREGVSFGELDEADRMFAESFPYNETPDQQAAIDAVLADMARSRPMDRLVCGDVGYGKTEVAMRAAFKAAHAGKQVAVLVPTTVLADQHVETFRARFEHTGVRVSCVSRFYSAQENKATLEALERGSVDILIGTHRLLQRDVKFRDIGLVIVDEEHRFGVRHKELLKRFRAEVDVLALSATPIPRTLQMSLSGIRDLSVIETAPVNRQVIQTYTAAYDHSIVREALLREYGRGGQAFFVYNRVQSIYSVVDELRTLVPEVKFGVGHGQMNHAELEKVMHQFVSREIDVLVCTTIVESGLDIPNANTIVIRDADMFGLAELYQLRGRVGRSDKRAYAYLLISPSRTLGEDARKRLQVLQTLDDLGVGFRLALQDMEIRGAGNILGKDQSGHVHLVGYELYSRILDEAVQELRRKQAVEAGNAPLPDVEPEMKLGIPLHIPVSYIPDIAERLLLYQRMISLSSVEEAAELREEIEDRFGSIPEEVSDLLLVMRLRVTLKQKGVHSVVLKGHGVQVHFHPEYVPNWRRLSLATKALMGRISIQSTGNLQITIAENETAQVIVESVEAVIRELGI